MMLCLICGHEATLHRSIDRRCPVDTEVTGYSDATEQYYCSDRRVCAEPMVQVDIIAVPDRVLAEGAPSDLGVGDWTEIAEALEIRAETLREDGYPVYAERAEKVLEKVRAVQRY